MESLVSLLDVIIWPITLLIIVYWFKSPLQNVFGRLNNVSASATGLSLSFSEKLAEAKQKVFELKRSSISKDGPSINTEGRKTFDFDQSMNELKVSLKQKAKESNVSSEGKTARELTSILKEKGILLFENSSLIDSFLELGEMSKGKETEQDKRDLQMIFEAIKL